MTLYGMHYGGYFKAALSLIYCGRLYLYRRVHLLRGRLLFERLIQNLWKSSIIAFRRQAGTIFAPVGPIGIVKQESHGT
jgi:hypothetical protein